MTSDATPRDGDEINDQRVFEITAEELSELVDAPDEPLAEAKVNDDLGTLWVRYQHTGDNDSE